MKSIMKYLQIQEIFLIFEITFTTTYKYFVPQESYTPSEYKASTAYVSEGVYDSWGTKYLYVIVNDFQKNYTNLVEPIYNSSLGRDNILARISLAPLLTTISEGTSLADQFNPGDFVRNYFGPVDIEKLRVTIVDEFGRVINLNNMDMSLALTFVCLYG